MTAIRGERTGESASRPEPNPAPGSGDQAGAEPPRLVDRTSKLVTAVYAATLPGAGLRTSRENPGSGLVVTSSRCAFV